MDIYEYYIYLQSVENNYSSRVFIAVFRSVYYKHGDVETKDLIVYRQRISAIGRDYENIL